MEDARRNVTKCTDSENEVHRLENHKRKKTSKFVNYVNNLSSDDETPKKQKLPPAPVYIDATNVANNAIVSRKFTKIYSNCFYYVSVYLF